MFLIHTVEDGHVPPFEYLPCGAIQPRIGMALTQSSGNLAIASGTTKPTYISMCEATGTLAAGTVIPVIRVTPDIVFETVASASISGINIGDRVTIASDGLRITATTSSGVAEVVYKDGDASGDMVRVRFA